MLTIKKVNAELVRLGIRAELVRGGGYFYFIGEDVELAKEQGVYGGVSRLNDLTLDQWVEEARQRMQNIINALLCSDSLCVYSVQQHSPWRRAADRRHVVRGLGLPSRWGRRPHNAPRATGRREPFTDATLTRVP